MVHETPENNNNRVDIETERYNNLSLCNSTIFAQNKVKKMQKNQ